jgi:hypothetical protein
MVTRTVAGPRSSRQVEIVLDIGVGGVFRPGGHKNLPRPGVVAAQDEGKSLIVQDFRRRTDNP